MDSVTSLETVGNVHVVTLRGEIDAFTAPSLRDDLRHLVEDVEIGPRESGSGTRLRFTRSLR